MDENDILNILQDYLERQLRASRLIILAHIERECNFAEGFAKQHCINRIKSIAHLLGYEVEREGAETILFKPYSRGN
jgi:hypothetical protein